MLTLVSAPRQRKRSKRANSAYAINKHKFSSLITPNTSTLVAIKDGFRLFRLFSCYNKHMDYVSATIEAFWQYHVAFAGILVPVLVIYIVFKFIRERFK